MASELHGLASLRLTPLDGDGDDDDEEENQNPIEPEQASDDEEDEEEYEGVTLGFAEKPKKPSLLLRQQFPSKAGGVPAWLDPVDLPHEKSPACGFCGEPLQFLLQIYAPISEKDSTFHRTLFVFMCPSMQCLLCDQHEQWKHGAGEPRRSVKVFRCQLPRVNSFYSCEPPRRDGSDKPLTAGAVLCCWCGTWRGEKVCSSCKKARYCSEKHQAMHWKSGHRNDCRKIIISSQASVSSYGEGREKLASMDKVASNCIWPEYEIEIEDESIFDTKISEDSSSGSSLVPKNNKVDEAYQLLMDKFEGHDDKRSWAAFQQRTAKAPEQVLRYSRDLIAKPLWPLLIGQPSEKDIPRCNYCHGSRCYEFQIMPQLLYFLSVRNDPDSLDWATIVVYTCLASCEASVSYKEEFAWVQLYPSSSIP